MTKPPVRQLVLLVLGIIACLAGCTTHRLARAVPGKPALIQGRVLFPGTPPPEHVIPVPPAVLAARTNAPLTTRFHRVSADGGLADVVVYVKRGLEGQTFPTTTNTQVIRVTGYEFWPYIAAVEMGQPIRWENHQSAGFNLNPTPTNLPSRQFNRALLPDRPVESAFLTPEEFVRVKTDVYPWLFHYVSVFDHPYFAVTDAEGRFRFPRPLPPGRYTLAAVHRRAGVSTQELVVDARSGPTKPLVFTLGPAQGRAAIQRKLAETRLPEVIYDGLPLPEVLKMLEQDTKRHDPAKQGVQFALRPAAPNSKPALDLDTVLIKVNTILRDISVLEALDAIVKTADGRTPDGQSAGLQFTIETNRVVFHPRLPGQKLVSPRLNQAVPGAALRARAEQLVLPTVSYLGLPLPEVIQLLQTDVRKHDPKNRGVNFLATAYFPDQPLHLRPVMEGSDQSGIPIPRTAIPVTLIDLNTVLIRLAKPLTNATLVQVLETIVRHAEVQDGGAITYRFEDWGVLFTPDYTRMVAPKPPAPRVIAPPHPPLPLATPVTPAAPSPGRPSNPALAREHCDRLEALVKTLRANPATTPQDFANVADLLAQALAEYAAVLPPNAPELARLKKLLEESKSPASKPGASLPPAAEGRARLSQRAEAATTQAGGLGQTRPTADARAPRDLAAEAEEEASRRQAWKLVLDLRLAEAEAFRKVKSWTNAVVRYEEAVGHAKLLGGVEPVEQQYRDALAGLIHCRLQLAVALQEKYQFKAAAAEVDKVLPFEPNNPLVAEFKKFNERVEAAHPGPLPRRAADAPLEGRSKVLALVRVGKLYFEVQEFQEARRRFEEAIAMDPKNEEAFYYLQLCMEGQFEWERRKRENPLERSQKFWGRTRNGLPVPNPYYRTNATAPFLTHSSRGSQRLNRKLEEIVLPEVHFDGVPLAEVMKRLDAEVRKLDPEPDPKLKGVNFLINDTTVDTALLEAAGSPVPAAQPVALSEGLIRVSQPLKNLTLRQALDVICKTAELPTQFRVEEYAIAFIPRGPVAYYARTFRVNPDTFMQGLRGVVGQAVPAAGAVVGQSVPAASGVGPASSPAGASPVRAVIPATVPATQRTAADANVLARQFFLSAGVPSLGTPNSATQVHFNPQTGTLVARGTTDELRIIEQALGKLPPSPPGQK